MQAKNETILKVEIVAASSSSSRSAIFPHIASKLILPKQSFGGVDMNVYNDETRDRGKVARSYSF